MKLFEKSLAMFLVVSMICSTIIFTGAVYADDTTVLYGQNFESVTFKNLIISPGDANKTDSTNASYIYKGNNVVSNKKSDGGRANDGLDNQTFNINSYGKIIKNYAYASFPAKEKVAPSDTYDVYVDADVYMNDADGTMHLMLVDDEAAALSSASVDFQFAPYAWADLAISSDGKAKLLTSYQATKVDNSNLFPSGATKNYGDSFDFTTKTWHKVRFVLHQSSYNVYVDGNLVASAQSFHTGNETFSVRRTNFSSLVIVTDANNGNGSAFVGFDNIYMYKAAAENAPANYARHLIKANEAMEKIENAKTLDDLTDNEYTNYKATVEEYRTTYQSALKSGAGESVFAKSEAATDAIVTAITLTIPEGGQKYSNTFDAGARCDAVYGIGNYWYDYTNSNEKVLYPHENTGVFSLKMKDDATVAKEGPNAGAVIEFDLKTSYLRETKSNLRLQVTDLVNTVDQGRKWFNVFINGSDGLVYKCYNGSASENIASTTYTTPFEDNKWYRVRIEIDVTDASSKFNGKQTMYVDGQKVFENDYTSTTAWGAFQELNGLQIVKDSNDVEGYGPIVAVDNLAVFKYNQNSEKPVNKGALIAYIRNSELIKNTSKLYDDATKDGTFKKELNKAIAAVEAEDATEETLKTALDNITWYMTSKRTGMLVPDNTESYYINNFIWKNSAGNAVYEAEAGGSLTGIRITKNSSANAASKVVVAQYQNGSVSDIRFAEIPAAMDAGATESLEFDTPFAVPSENPDDYSYKAFIWTEDNMYPITETEYSVVNTEKTGTKIFVIGDSIACNYNYSGENNDYPQQGFGQALVNFFDSSKITVDNRAISGYSTKKFIDDGKWSEVLQNMKKGDYLIIAFGHNDEKTDSALSTYAYTTYRDNLERFVKEARAKGANPILMTPVPRALATQNTFVGIPDHMAYPLVVKDVAEEFNVVLIDALTKVNEIISDTANYTVANARRDIYLFVDEDDARYATNSAFETSKYKSGVEDTTHLSVYGAQVVAKVICDILKDINHPLKDYMTTFTPQKN